MKNKIIVVYNADSGAGNTLMDIAHKAISPSTYSCALCQLTHGIFSAKSEWETFLNESEMQVEVMHKDEFELKYSKQLKYPVILDGDSLKVILTPEEIGKISSTEELINKLNEVIK